MTNAFFSDALAAFEAAAIFAPGASLRLALRWSPRTSARLAGLLGTLTADWLRLDLAVTEALVVAGTPREIRLAARLLLAEAPPARLCATRALFEQVVAGWLSGLSDPDIRALARTLRCSPGTLPRRIALALYSPPAS